MEELFQNIRDVWYALPLVTRDALTIIILFFILWTVKRIILKRIITRIYRYTNETERHWDSFLVDNINRPLNFVTFAITLGIIAAIGDWGNTFETFIIQTSNTAVMIAIVMFVLALTGHVFTNHQRLIKYLGFDIEPQLLPFVRTTVRFVIIALGVVLVLDEWGYDVNGLIAGLGIGGLAVALAAQDTISNIFGFTTIVGDRPFNKGDFIKTSDAEGIVEHIGLRSTRVRQLDQALVTLPNSMLTNAAILNWSQLYKRRFDAVVGITYTATSDDIRELIARIRRLLGENIHVQKDSIVVYFINFGESSLEVLVRCYINISDWGGFTAEKQEINLQIMDIVEDMQLSFAFPTRSIFMEPTAEESRAARAGRVRESFDMDVDHSRIKGGGGESDEE